MNLYVVRNKQGQFFRAKGYGGSGQSWVDTLEKSRLYTKIGPAKATITYFARTGPEFGVPDLLEFAIDVTQGRVIDMSATATKSVSRIKRQKIEREARQKTREIERLQEERARITARLKTIT